MPKLLESGFLSSSKENVQIKKVFIQEEGFDEIKTTDMPMTLEEIPIAGSKLTFEQMLQQEIQKNSVHEDNLCNKTHESHELRGIMESSISNNDQAEDNTKNETSEELHTLTTKIHEIKPYLKKGQGYVVKKLESRNETKKLTECQSINFPLQ